MKREKINFAIVILLFCLTAKVYSQGDLPAEKIYDLVNNSVVVVLAYDGAGNQYQGSGVVINKDGYVVTNYHVCKDANKFEVNHYKKEFKDVEIVRQDPDKDILILKVKDNPLSSIKTGSSEDLKPGQRVYAIGSPEGFENSISEGIVSGVRIDSNGNEVIQMTTPITDGSSGGAVVNSKGELVGMSMSGQHEGNIYFAVPVEDIMKLLDPNYVASMERENKTEQDQVNYFSEGKDANKQQKYEDAIFYFSKYLENNLYDKDAYFYRAYARIKLKEYKLAIIDFTKAIGSGTENYEAYFFRGNAYYYLSDYTNALTDYSSAINLSPELAELYYNRGYANLKLKNFPGALSDWKTAIELKPEYEIELSPKMKLIQNK
jgi:tetratricopeptide (TPR) repeat protein